MNELKLKLRLLPFDLEKALAGHKVVTHSEKPVTELKLFHGGNEDYPLYGVLDKKVSC